MSLLQERAGQIVAREELLTRFWDRSSEGASNVLAVVIVSLRRKLGQRGGRIETIRGAGYRFRG
jgi:DNA-binding response OmpR family regulator